MPKFLKANAGFTLIELLVVIGILAVLLSITLIAINPARQFQQANDTQRRSDVNAILNAIHSYAADHSGSLPAGISTSIKTIADPTSVPTGADLCSNLAPTYIASLPFDPTTGSSTDCTTYNTGYKVIKSATNSRVTVSATGEQTVTISVTR